MGKKVQLEKSYRKKLDTTQKIMKLPLVSIVIPVRKNESTLKSCLKSIHAQTYKNIEVKVVDLGLERNYQRNWGAKKAKGKYLLFIDADMELSSQVVEQSVQTIEKNERIVGVIIPEKSFGEGFWAQCRQLEKSFYVGADWIEAARFFPKKIFEKVGGYDRTRISGEDWDLSQRVSRLGRLERINAFIHHNEGKLTLSQIIRKKYYYATKIRQDYIYLQTSVFRRYIVFFKNPKKLFSNPVVGIGMLFMKGVEFSLGALAYMFYGTKRS